MGLVAQIHEFKGEQSQRTLVRFVLPCYNVLNPTVSLSQTKDMGCFKLYLSDIGLIISKLQISEGELKGMKLLYLAISIGGKAGII